MTLPPHTFIHAPLSIWPRKPAQSQAHVLKEIKTNSNQTVGGRGEAVMKKGEDSQQCQMPQGKVTDAKHQHAVIPAKSFERLVNKYFLN